MNFRIACYLAAALCAFLTIRMVVVPVQMIGVLGIVVDQSGGVAVRRMGLVFAGLAVIYAMIASSEDAQTRRAIAVGTLVSMGSLAVVGVLEYLRGLAGPSIIYIAVVIELVLCVAFWPWVQRCENRPR